MSWMTPIRQSFGVVYFVILISLIEIVSTNDESTERQERLRTLQLVQIFHRHGERNPLTSLGPLYPDDVQNFPEGFGMITKNGEKQMFKLGQFFRHRYDGYLDKLYKSDEIFILSSDIDRTIQSAISVVRSLYPPVEEGDQLVPIRTIDKELDDYTRDCPKFKEIFGQIMTQSNEINELEESNVHILQELNKVTGRQAKSWGQLIFLMDYLQVLVHQNKTLPPWVSEEMSLVLQTYIRQLVLLTMHNDDIKKLRSTTMKKVISNMRQKTSGEILRKMFIYSCHDLTILAILGSLGFRDVDSMPPYSSFIIFELHKKQNYRDYIVQMYFKNTTTTGNTSFSEQEHENFDEVFKLEIPNCGSPCFLNRLDELMRPYILKDLDKACQVTPESKSDLPSVFNEEIISISIPPTNLDDSCQSSTTAECDRNLNAH